VDNEERGGRPPSFEKGSQLDDVLISLLKKYRKFTPILIATKFEEITGKHFSPKTIKRMAYRANFYRVLTSKAPLLNEDHKKKRIHFARENREEERDDVVFIDEKIFVFTTSGRVWKTHEEPPITSYKSQQNYKWMVWRGIWMGGKTKLHIRDSDDHIDAEEYQNIIWEYFIEPMENNEIDNPFLRLLQDNATPHKDKGTMEFFDNFDVDIVENYPPCSPDLNPIEKVWGWMVQYIDKRGPTTPDEYFKLIGESWNNIPMNIINVFISHQKKVVCGIIHTE